MLNAKKFMVVITCALLLTGSGWVHAAKMSAEGKKIAKSFGVIQPRKAKKAEDFRLLDAKGKKLSLKDFEGKAVVLNFWASWCTPCIVELPDLTELHAKYQDKGLVVLGVSLDASQKSFLKAVEKHKIKFPTVHDPKLKVGKVYRAGALPTTYFIDRQGNIVGYSVGPRKWMSSKSHEWMDYLLKL